MNQIAFEKAMREISNRRFKAQMENEKRCDEIAKKIPAIAEINSKLSQTVVRILNGEDIETVKRQNLEAQKQCQQLLANFNYPKDYLDLHYTCEKCNDTGYTNNGKYCTCFEKLVSKFAIEDMNKNAQIKLCSFEQFSLEYYKNQKCYT
ncbi:MAG: DNA replication protein DnaC, partial [Oscillospiraceae bacterium]|nr:DNA replication protein DnaC [Oscillospiraceae bacterium]